MPGRRLWIRKETRLLGAIQIMTGLNIHGVGLIWTYLFLSQRYAFGKSYLPLSVLTGYPYWSSTCCVLENLKFHIFLASYFYWTALDNSILTEASATYIFSGVLTVIAERRRTSFLLFCTITVNIISACIAVNGLLLLSAEFMIYSLSTQAPIWPWRSGKILSEYLVLFTFLELFLTCTVVHWGYKAKYRR